ncbi:MAG: MarR family transcriptional regulator, partial [Actinomycetota bacterium]|nr:MarR family transcriptional regulator [Actinomycetota bacterium]
PAPPPAVGPALSPTAEPGPSPATGPAQSRAAAPPRPTAAESALSPAWVQPSSAVAGQALSPGEDEVVGALLALSRALVGLAARSLADLDEDVTLQQYRTLVFLVSYGPLRVVDLAHELNVTSSTATRLCARLERKHLVARQERPDDRRAAWITLTGSGRELVGAVMRRRRDILSEMIAELSLTRPLALAATLNALVEASGELPDSQWWHRLGAAGQ